MAANLIPIGNLGAVEQAGVVSFGIWLPWIAPAGGFSLSVKLIHEHDQFLQAIPAREFPMAHSLRAPYGDFWSATVAIAGTAPMVAGSAWGTPGRYLYRYCLDTADGRVLDFIVDPFAREFGPGQLSAFTLGYTPYAWSAGEAAWKTPALADLVVYEIDIAEFGGSLERTCELFAYLADLGVNAIEVMPLSNVPGQIDWGYLPIGYFGVDERLGHRSDFQRLVDLAHQQGVAVIVDQVYGHTGSGFAYYDVYSRLGFAQNPFMGPFAQDLFSGAARSTDYTRQMTQDYFLTANHHWLDVYHVDGVRYDCVPNYWDGPTGVGYANIVYRTYQLAKQHVASGDAYWGRFDGGAGAPLCLVQCAEQLEDPKGILSGSYSNSTWQNGTFDAMKAVARGDRGRLVDLGLQLGLFGYPESESFNGDYIPKTALQYFENHDHERFICNFGLVNPDDSGNPLFLEGDRSRWFALQPYLIALLMSKGIPLLWEGQELGQNYYLPDSGTGRVALLRPTRWDFFYDDYGRALIGLVRKLLRIRRARPHIRSGQYFFFNDWERYASHDVLLFARYDGPHYTLVALNTGDLDQTVPFWFPLAGDYVEELHGGALNLSNVPAWQQTWITVPSHYGRIWTAA